MASKGSKSKLDPRKDDVSLIIADMDRFFNDLMKSKRKTLEFLINANIISIKQAPISLNKKKSQ